MKSFFITFVLLFCFITVSVSITKQKKKAHAQATVLNKFAKEQEEYTREYNKWAQKQGHSSIVADQNNHPGTENIYADQTKVKYDEVKPDWANKQTVSATKPDTSNSKVDENKQITEKATTPTSSSQQQETEQQTQETEQQTHETEQQTHETEQKQVVESSTVLLQLQPKKAEQHKGSGSDVVANLEKHVARMLSWLLPTTPTKNKSSSR